MLTLAEFYRLSQQEKLRRYGELSDRDKHHIQMTCDPGACRVVCNDCRCYIGLAKCTIYPNRIPREILLCDGRGSLPVCFELEEQSD